MRLRLSFNSLVKFDIHNNEKPTNLARRKNRNRLSGEIFLSGGPT